MKKLFGISAILIALALMSALTYAQADQPSASPPLSQPLVREGDFAVTLANSLKLGPAADETEAESALSEVGIAPRNGWIADYPVTPDIVGELQSAVGEAAEAGRLAMGKVEALNAFQSVVTQNSLDVRMDTSGSEAGDTSGAEYADTAVINDFYANEGPPVVTYYAPPPDYTYMYTWVPYPFWWWNYWLPGFFVLTDFHVRVHDHGHGHGHDEHKGGHGEFVSNHFRDPKTGRVWRVDPTNRFRGGSFSSGGRTAMPGPPAQIGARPNVVPRSAPSGRAPGVTSGRTPAVKSGQAPSVRPSQELRGYGSPRSSVGTRSSAFDRSSNSRVERSSGSRGIESRTNAGHSPGGRSIGGGSGRGGAPVGSRGGGSSRGSGGGGGSRSGGGGRR